MTQTNHGRVSPAQRLAYLAAGSGPVTGATGATFSAISTPVAIPDGGTQTASSWTAECWVKFVSSTNTYSVALCRNVGGTNAPGSWAMGVSYNGSVYAVFNTSTQSIQLTAFTPLNDGAYHHYVMQVTTSGSSSTYQIYLGGILQTGYPTINGTGAGTATSAYVGPQWVPDAGNVAGSVSYIGGSAGRSGEGGFVGSVSEVSISGVAQYSANFTPPAAPFAASRTSQKALYHLNGNPFDSNVTGLSAATGATAVSDPVLTVGVARPVAFLFNGIGPGAFTPSVAGASGTYSNQALTSTYATYTLTPSATGQQTDDGLGAATLSGTGTGLTTTASVVPVAPVTSPPTATNLTAAWKASLDALFTTVYNARYDTRLPYALWGDGVTDCLTAIEANKAFISANGLGGGVLYLPAGNYPVASTAGVAQSCPSNVAVVGDTNLAAPAYVSNDTAIAYNSGLVRTVITYDTTSNYGFCPNFTSNALLMHLTLRNGAAAAAQKNHVAFWATYGAPLDRLAFDGVEWITGDDGGLYLSYAAPLTRFAFENCRLDSTGDVSSSAPYGGTFSAMYCTDLTFRNNSYRYPRGRVYFNSGLGGYIGGSQFIRTQPLSDRNVESGGPDISFCHGVSQAQPYVIENNLITVDGPVDQENFGEALCAQGDGGAGTYRNFCDVGTLTGVAGNVLTDAAKSWYLTPPQAGVSNINGWQNASGPLVVCMTGGAALGQYRTVTAHTATTITLDSAFSPAPAAGDSYCVTTWVLQDVVVRNNVFYNNWHETLGGIGAYQGACRLSYLNNTLVNSGGVVLNGWDDTTGFHAPVWNSQVVGNKISNPNGLMLGFVGTQFCQIGATLHGNLAYGNRCYGNVITPTPAMSTATNSPLAYSQARTEGVFQSFPNGTYWSNQPVAAQRTALSTLNGDAPFPGLLYTVTGAAGAQPIPAAASVLVSPEITAPDAGE